MNRRALFRSLAGLVAGGAIAKPVVAYAAAKSPATGGMALSDTCVTYVINGSPEVACLPVGAQVKRTGGFRPWMEPGRIYCDRCDASAFPRFGWQGPEHVAVRLWDDDPELRYGQMPTYATVDGERTTMTLEAMAGDPGWVLRHVTYRTDDGRERVKPCMTCLLGELCEVVVGKVEFEQPNWADLDRAYEAIWRAQERAMARAWLGDHWGSR